MNDAQVLTSYELEFKLDAKRIINIFLYVKISSWIFRMNDRHIIKLCQTEAPTLWRDIFMSMWSLQI
jgi:hypothetical protein